MLLTRPVRGDAEVPVLSKAAFSVGATEALPSGSAQDVVSEDGTDEPGTEDAHFDNIIVQRDSTGILHSVGHKRPALTTVYLQEPFLPSFAFASRRPGSTRSSTQVPSASSRKSRRSCLYSSWLVAWVWFFTSAMGPSQTSSSAPCARPGST